MRRGKSGHWHIDQLTERGLIFLYRLRLQVVYGLSTSNIAGDFSQPGRPANAPSTKHVIRSPAAAPRLYS